MKLSVGFSAIHNNLSKQGIIVGATTWNASGWWYQLSLDEDVKIVDVHVDDVSILSLIPDEDIFYRLLRDIYSNDTLTRVKASSSLCDFVEFTGPSMDINVIKKELPNIINRLEVEKDSDVGGKLSEAICEYLVLGQVDEQSKVQLLKQLSMLQNDFVYEILTSYDDLGIQEIEEYIKRKDIEWQNAANTGLPK